MQASQGATLDRLLYDLTVAIQPTRRAWVQAAGIALTACGLSVPLATVILTVYRSGRGVPQNSVALEVGVNPAALVRTLDQGEKAALLKRCDGKVDRRTKEIELLPAGEATARQIEEDIARLRRQLLGELPEQDVEAAIRVLRHLESAATGYAKQGKP
ncbi:MarR family winged helix-turn-helix transcriptional regulator [Stenotrophomonas maltophilia]|uniref:MarR family winged helix-turn-helix transcriptional regulator n=1 Tax=Stenotrophomonas maltophilia TaxID=40324 RepID=UPI0013DB8223|nr:MarR family winged helix-turn-helix transcriptional regulator [Stenotrophomonas maltophilia]